MGAQKVHKIQHYITVKNENYVIDDLPIPKTILTGCDLETAISVSDSLKSQS